MLTRMNEWKCQGPKMFLKTILIGFVVVFPSDQFQESESKRYKSEIDRQERKQRRQMESLRLKNGAYMQELLTIHVSYFFSSLTSACCVPISQNGVA